MTANATLPPAAAAWLDKTLERHAESPADRIEPLAVEASTRLFFRVHAGATTRVLMCSPPATENNAAFVAVAELLARHGVGVPDILAHDVDAGLLLLTDLGSRHFGDLYAAGDAQRCLDAAEATLAQLRALPTDAVPDYTPARLSDELDICIDWLVRPTDSALPDALFEPAREGLLANAADQEQVFVHRDFHCRNLLLRADDSVGVVDFQDALIGPEHYDRASLLYDCYWRFDDDTIARHAPSESWRMERLAIQRQLKAVGIFARLASRDDKTTHLRYIDDVLACTISLCARQDSAPLRRLGEWLEATLAPNARRWVAARSC
ncbi:MAG: phosphotransferase [Pseudomonadota bacterium]